MTNNDQKENYHTLLRSGIFLQRLVLIESRNKRYFNQILIQKMAATLLATMLI